MVKISYEKNNENITVAMKGDAAQLLSGINILICELAEQMGIYPVSRLSKIIMDAQKIAESKEGK